MIGRSVRYPIAVDVGAYGRQGYNTYDLLRHFGWRGVHRATMMLFLLQKVEH